MKIVYSPINEYTYSGKTAFNRTLDFCSLPLRTAIGQKHIHVHTGTQTAAPHWVSRIAALALSLLLFPLGITALACMGIKSASGEARKIKQICQKKPALPEPAPRKTPVKETPTQEKTPASPIVADEELSETEASSKTSPLQQEDLVPYTPDYLNFSGAFTFPPSTPSTSSDFSEEDTLTPSRNLSDEFSELDVSKESEEVSPKPSEESLSQTAERVEQLKDLPPFSPITSLRVREPLRSKTTPLNPIKKVLDCINEGDAVRAQEILVANLTQATKKEWEPLLNQLIYYCSFTQQWDNLFTLVKEVEGILPKAREELFAETCTACLTYGYYGKAIDFVRTSSSEKQQQGLAYVIASSCLAREDAEKSGKICKRLVSEGLLNNSLLATIQNEVEAEKTLQKMKTKEKDPSVFTKTIDEYCKKKLWDKAFALLQNNTLSPTGILTTSELYLKLAYACLADKSYARAIKALRANVMWTSQQEEKLVSDIIDACLTHEGPERALKIYKEIDPKKLRLTDNSLLAIREQLLKNGNLTLFSEAIELCENFPSKKRKLLIQLAEEYLKKTQIPEAIEVFDRLEETYFYCLGENLKLINKIVDLCVKEDEWELVLSLLRKEKNPPQYKRKELVKKILTQYLNLKAPTAKNNKILTELSSLLQETRLSITYPELAVRMSETCIHLGNLDEAFKIAAQIKDPKFAHPLLVKIGLGYIDAGQIDKAAKAEKAMDHWMWQREDLQLPQALLKVYEKQELCTETLIFMKKVETGLHALKRRTAKEDTATRHATPKQLAATPKTPHSRKKRKPTSTLPIQSSGKKVRLPPAATPAKMSARERAKQYAESIRLGSKSTPSLKRVRSGVPRTEPRRTRPRQENVEFFLRGGVLLRKATSKALSSTPKCGKIPFANAHRKGVQSAAPLSRARSATEGKGRRIKVFRDVG